MLLRLGKLHFLGIIANLIEMKSDDHEKNKVSFWGDALGRIDGSFGG